MQVPSFRQTIPRVVRPLYDFLYPPVCFCCDSPVHDDSVLCEKCSSSFTSVSPASSLHRSVRTRLCHQGFCAEIVSPFLFEADRPIHDLIHALKYSGRTRLGLALGSEIGRCISARGLAEGISGIIPVPLHRTKRRERGYNQTEFIAEGISSWTGIPVSLVMKRVRYTASQTTLSPEKRADNVAGAFVVDPRVNQILSRKRFLLVDDVITTGATIDACAEALVGAGALRPVACSIALATQ